jgi:putative restriction endonuclease
VEEVNFWRPSPDVTFRALTLGEPLLFKLHAPRNYIAGGGFFTKFVQLPVSLAWDAFREGNRVHPACGTILLSRIRLDSGWRLLSSPYAGRKGL